MKSSAELKELAKEQIKGKIGILFLISLIISAITFAASSVLSLIPFIGPIAYEIFIGPAFILRIIRIYQTVANFNNPEVSDAFYGFEDFWTAFKALFFVGLFSFLWGLLFIIPGIIKSYSYSQTMMIVAENKGIGALDAINRSKEMMEGHKADLFILELSFIGWGILTILTLGIVGIWAIPYMETTLVNFYNEIKPKDVLTLD